MYIGEESVYGICPTGLLLPFRGAGYATAVMDGRMMGLSTTFSKRFPNICTTRFKCLRLSSYCCAFIIVIEDLLLIFWSMFFLHTNLSFNKIGLSIFWIRVCVKALICLNAKLFSVHHGFKGLRRMVLGVFGFVVVDHLNVVNYIESNIIH